ncbi:START-like domain-containing protein [Bacteroidota bacterium]
MEKLELEYTINSSPKVLFTRLSTPAGLAEWFADDVNVQGKVYTFIWEGSEQSAELTARKENKYVRFHWLDDDADKSFFEFKINIDELTGDVALVITDFVEEDEKDDAVDLWDSQITELKRAIGL